MVRVRGLRSQKSVRLSSQYSMILLNPRASQPARDVLATNPSGVAMSNLPACIEVQTAKQAGDSTPIHHQEQDEAPTPHTTFNLPSSYQPLLKREIDTSPLTRLPSHTVYLPRPGCMSRPRRCLDTSPPGCMAGYPRMPYQAPP